MAEEGGCSFVINGGQYSASVSGVILLLVIYYLTLSTCTIMAYSDPRRFCEFLLAKCKESNVTVIYPARAVGVATDVVSGLPVALSYTTPELSEHTIPCTDLLLAAGPWTGRVYEDLFPKSDLKLPISNLAGWSVVYRDPTPPTFSALAPCYSAFTTSASEGFSPEVFSRLSHVTSGEGSNLQDKSQINRDIYLAGLNSADLPLPNVATEVAAPKLDDPQIASLLRVGRRVFSSLSNQLNETTTKEIDSLDILRTNLCHRPVTPSGRPILTRLGPQHYASHVQLTSTATETETASHGTMGGLYICAGHGPWGISLSLGSGKVCADLILGHTNALVYSSELDANLSFPPHTK
jgi:glycine/D-amino acid oxidase-like deaminating enzyme